MLFYFLFCFFCFICSQLRRPAKKQPISRIIGIPHRLWEQMEHGGHAPDTGTRMHFTSSSSSDPLIPTTDSRVVMWSYLRQNHTKKAEALAAQVLDEARAAFNLHDEAWNTQFKLMVSNVLKHMKINLENFSPLQDPDPKSYSNHFLALVQDWMLARASRSSVLLPHEDLSSSFPVQSKQAIASAAASSSSRTTPPRVRGSSSAVASAAAAAIGIEPFPLLSLMRTLRRRDADWSPDVCFVIEHTRLVARF
jgi:hypothetical protein